VFGTTAELPKILAENRPDEVLIAIPSASGEVRQRDRRHHARGAIPVKTLPGIYELISGDLDLAGQIRAVQVEDVLGREPVEVDLRRGLVVHRRRDGARHRRRAGRSAPSSAARSPASAASA
jgi:FlaA1/EpsC-like NDP-sugar epimerase